MSIVELSMKIFLLFFGVDEGIDIIPVSGVRKTDLTCDDSGTIVWIISFFLK